MNEKRIRALCVYPIKSCASIPLIEARLTPTGLEFDREFLLVDERGVFISQRKYPQMALIQPRIQGSTMTLEAPGIQPISIHLGEVAGERMSVKVWDDTIEAVRLQSDVHDWFRTVLGTANVSLVRFVQDVHRYIDKELLGETGAESKFADQYPLTLVSEASVADLNTRLRTPIDYTRFRSNIVVSGYDPYEEDTVSSVRVGASGIVLKIVKPVKRCKIVNIDQTMGTVGGEEVLKTLASYRTRQVGKPGILFCVKVLIEQGIGEVLKVGDELVSIE